jgi:pimeloyl-ACP methyl ester carboxylesterase
MRMFNSSTPQRSLLSWFGGLLLIFAAITCFGQEGMVDVGGYRLQVRVRGEGVPAVVFLNGGSASMDYWDEVVQNISETVMVVTYERAGHGMSEPATEPRHGINIAKELKALLVKLKMPTPCILVAHSAGCMYARIFVQEYPRDVSGMILLDPGDKDVLDAFGERFLEGSARGRWEQYWNTTWESLGKRPDGFGEEIRMKDTTLTQMSSKQIPIDLALYVVSGMDRERPHYYLQDYGEKVIDDFYDFVRDYHASLVEGMPDGKHVPVHDARHVIHQDRPDLVISLIRSLLDASSAARK